MLKACDWSGKKTEYIEFISKQLFVFTFLSLQFKFSAQPCILIKLLLNYIPSPSIFFFPYFRLFASNSCFP